jgi:hypothetical protein
MKTLLYIKFIIINLIFIALPIKAAEDNKEHASSYISICIGSLQEETNWLLKNTDTIKLSEQSEKAIIEKIQNSLNQIKKIACNPEYDKITFTVKKRERIKAEIVLKFEGQINNADAALDGFDSSLNNNATCKDK